MSGTDVVVAGGGIIGSACARSAARRGLHVVLCEPGPLPGAASPAAAGMLAAQIECDDDAMLALAVRARDLYGPLATELRAATGIDIGLWRTGILSVAFDEARGNRVANQSAFGGSGTLRNVVLVPGVRGSALDFRGPNTRFDFNDLPGLNFEAGQPFTYAGWLRTDRPEGVILSQRRLDNASPVLDVSVRNGQLRAEFRPVGNAIDPVTTMRIEAVLTELKSTMTIVMVTNLLAQARRIADRTLFLLEGHVVEEGPTAQVFDQPTDVRTGDYVNGRFG